MPTEIPRDANVILDQVGARARLIFDTVRSIVDDTEKAAPWSSLYSPSESEQEFLQMQRALLEVVESIPARVQKVFEQLDQLGGEGHMAAGELASYFDTTFIITSHDRDQLIAAINQADSTKWTNERQNQVCQISADLKGKYQSALMGVTAKVIAQGRWSGVDIEPVLFAEKRQEFERNHVLVQSLDAVTTMIRELSSEMPLKELIAAWTAKNRTDRYALVDFTIIAGKVGQLLKEQSRRALYSGDYHQILDHDRQLSERVNKLQIMHASTWAENSRMNIVVIFPRLVELTTEIVAILDLQLLRSLVSEERYVELRDKAETTSQGPAASPSHDDNVVNLIRQGDLRTFLEALLGNVMKRESLVAERTQAAAGPSEDEVATLAEIRTVMAAIFSPDRPQWQAFLATVADPSTTPLLAKELLQDIQRRLIPLIKSADSVAQFGTILASTCNEIHSTSNRQPLQTVLRLLNRLQVVLSEN